MILSIHKFFQKEPKLTRFELIFELVQPVLRNEVIYNFLIILSYGNSARAEIIFSIHY